MNTAAARKWAVAEGMEVPSRGKLPQRIIDQYLIEHPEDETAVDPESAVLDRAADDTVVDAEIVDDPYQGSNEKPPVPPKTAGRKWFGKKEKPAATRKRRVSLADTLETTWEVAALGIGNTVSPSVARLMGIQAPVAGELLEDRIRGTLVDRVLQPFARMHDGAKGWYTLIAPPLLVMAIERTEGDVQQKLIGALRKALVDFAIIAKPKMEKRIEREAKAAEAMGDIDIDAMLQFIFSGEKTTSEGPKFDAPSDQGEAEQSAPKPRPRKRTKSAV